MKSLVLVFMLLACFASKTFAAAVEPLEIPVEKSAEDESTTQINTECHQPKEIGRCFAIFTRYAFNPENHQCEEFIYGGCSGNSNNFETKEECEVKCLQKINTETDAPLVREEPQSTTEYSVHKLE